MCATSSPPDTPPPLPFNADKKEISQPRSPRTSPKPQPDTTDSCWQQRGHRCSPVVVHVDATVEEVELTTDSCACRARHLVDYQRRLGPDNIKRQQQQHDVVDALVCWQIYGAMWTLGKLLRLGFRGGPLQPAKQFWESHVVGPVETTQL